MTETEADDYKLNAEGIQQTLHVSLINNSQIGLILINFSKNLRYSSYLSLQSLKKLSQAFSNVKTIQEALTIIKTTIESGNIALSQDPKDNSMAINFEITLESGSYPEFEVNLNLEESQNNNDQEELPVTYDYQGNVEAQMKYENNPNSTTEYSKPIIKSDIKPPIVQLEYIEPILQVHYPDGTTKSKALPPRIQGANGEKANISEEQFKLIQEQMGNNNISNSKRFSPIKDSYNSNRSNSVNKSETSMYSTQTMPYLISRNMANKNPFGNNVVRSALNDNGNNNNNINQVRSAFSNNPNSTSYNKTQYFMQNGNNSFQTPNQNNFNNTAVYSGSHYMTQTHNVRNVMEERRPRMTANVNNMSRTTTRSLSTPGRENGNAFNPNRAMYQANQVNYGYQTNNMGTFNTSYGNNKIPQRQGFNGNVNVVHLDTPGLNSYNNPNNLGIYGQNGMNQLNNNNQFRPNNNSQAMKQSQELIQRHQKRLQEVQRQLAQIQQQQQKLQEAQRQLMQQQQYQRQMIQNQTLINRSNSQVMPNTSKASSKFKGFAQVSQLNTNNKQYNTQIRQAQTLTNNNQSFTTKSSQEIKQAKTSINQSSNAPLRTQISTPMSYQTPSLRNYQKQTSQNGIEDEISEQQIALAQMASMQNQANPNYQNLQAITLQQREEELQPEQEENQEQQVQEEEQVEQTQERETDGEQMDIEALFMTEEGRIIFRNGLLRGIIHKYAEIDDVISKIQDILLKGVKFNLVYKAFELDDKAETFHKKCDKLNMSLVLIETDNDVRFGGFTTKSWEGNNIKKKDNSAFVFNLDTNSIFDIIKNEPAIGCYPKFGPVFFGCQIRIYDEFFTKGGTTCHKGLNYKTKKDYELNNGEQKYLIKDIEVYSIEAIDI